MIAFKWFAPLSVHEVALLGATLSGGAIEEDWHSNTHISTALHVLRALFHEVTLLTTLEVTSGAIATRSWMVPTTLSTYRSPITSLCHYLETMHVLL